MQVNCGSTIALKQQIDSILAALHSNHRSGYGSGNLINLCRILQFDLTGYDFSQLPIWQACLQGIDLKQVNFNGANFNKSVFTRTFGMVLSVNFSLDGKLIISSNSKGEVRVGRIADMQPTLICSGHRGWVMSVRSSPDGKILASGSLDRTIKLWDARTGELLRTLISHKNLVMSVSWSPDGQTLASASEDRNNVFLMNPPLVNTHLRSVVELLSGLTPDSSQSQSCNIAPLLRPGVPATSIHLPERVLLINLPLVPCALLGCLTKRSDNARLEKARSKLGNTNLL